MPADCYIQGELLGISVYSVGLYLHTLKQLIDLLINNHDPIAPDSPLVTVTTVIIPLEPSTSPQTQAPKG